MVAEPAAAPPSRRPQPTTASTPYSPGTGKVSLYVGDLNPRVTEKDLESTFHFMGPIASIRLCRDFRTGKSLRYAYVDFFSHSHASKAIECLNRTELKGRPMRVMWSQRDPLSRKTEVGNLFVKNLDSSMTSAKLQGMFSKFGNILSCKVSKENGTSKGFGFVCFDSEDSAMAALTALHNSTVQGKKLHVSKFVKRSVRTKTNEERASTNLFFKNLDYDITEDFLQELFSEFGKVSSLNLLKDGNGNSRGFGFVKFESLKEAKNAVEHLNGLLLGSKHLVIETAQIKVEKKMINYQFEKFKDTNNLCVKNLDLSVNDTKLRDHFSCCGKVISVRVMRFTDGTSKGYGFVCFSAQEEAKKALHSLNGTVLEGRHLRLILAPNREYCNMVSEDYIRAESSSRDSPENLADSAPAPFLSCAYIPTSLAHSFQYQPIGYFGGDAGASYPFLLLQDLLNQWYTYVPGTQLQLDDQTFQNFFSSEYHREQVKDHLWDLQDNV
ncbi:polyadenylate-binding protein 4-like [Morus notabilis]|uniref:polyadenylate-binding protein 4-like n=1 Tax=Morus notabilis TaxID=981085 RepID=UPI000CED4939|nr:polyadenylate-binding protein 4-like [Morus notabilis]